jgi:hypothetical protein
MIRVVSIWGQVLGKNDAVAMTAVAMTAVSFI